MATEANTRVLYMEDEAGLAHLLKRRMKRQGCAVDIAKDSTAGFQLLEENAYDLVLVDYKLPMRSGLEVIRILAQQPQAPPMIMITGAGNERLAVEALQQGASDYIVKDSETLYLEILPSKIDRAIEQHRLEHEAAAAQEALRISEGRFRALFEQSNDAIFIINPDGQLVDVNQRGSDMLNITPAELTQRSFATLIAEDEHRAQFQACLDIDEPEHQYTMLEWMLHKQPNEMLPVEVSITRMVMEEDQDTQLQIIARDISERKKAEAALRESEERLRSTVESLDDIVLLVNPDMVFFDFYRPRSNVAVEIPIDTFMGHTVAEVLPSDIAAQFHEAIAITSQTGEVQQFDYPLAVGNTSYWFSVKISQRRNVNGEHDGVTVVVRDVTSRRNDLETLRRSEEHFKSLFEFAPNGLLILSLDGRIRQVNQAFCKMLESKSDHLLDIPLASLVHPYEASNLDFSDLDTESSTVRTEARFLRTDRQIVHASVQAAYLKFTSRLNDYVLVQVSDISDRKTAENELRSYVHQLELIQQIDEEMHRVLTVPDVLEVAANTVHAFSAADSVYIALADSTGTALTLATTVNVADAQHGQPLVDGNIGWTVAASMTPEWVDDVFDGKYRSLVSGSIMAVGLPLISQGRLLGVVVLESANKSRVTLDMFGVLVALADRISVALTGAQILQENQQLRELQAGETT
jgi:PAS domain S-box-containing protein